MATERFKLPRIPIKKLVLNINAADFTDGGAAAGTYTSTKKLPRGAKVLETKIQTTVGFTGDTSAAIIVGNATGSDDYAATATGYEAAKLAYTQPASLAEGMAGTLAAAVGVLVTVTTAADFTLAAVTGGKLQVEVSYLDPDAKPY